MPNPAASPSSAPLGRLVLVLDTDAHPATCQRLKSLLADFYARPEPTFVTSLAQPSFLGALQADPGGVFYNSDAAELTLPETMTLLPWAELWVVAAGKLWRGLPSS